MPSVRSHLLRLMMKYFVAPRFKRATSIAGLRNTLERLSKAQKIPSGTEIRSMSFNGHRGKWVRATRTDADHAVLYLHGGACVMGSPATHRELAVRLSTAANARLLSLDYRLAPEHPFPAAVQDAARAYLWLQDEGYTNQHVAIGGDSSGSGLALQTLLTLRDEGIALPAACFFLSPQTDWVHFDGESYSTRAKVDFWYTSEMFRLTALAYVGDNDPKTPLLSPVHMDLFGLPPLCIHVGDHDVLLSDAVRLAERARGAGAEVELKVWPGMWHVFQASARFVPEGRQSICEIGGFLRSRLGSDTL